MLIDEAKKILAGDVTTISSEVLQEAAKIILSELVKAEEKISELEKKIAIGCIEDLPGEVWKDIEIFKDYQISNCGRLRSHKKGNEWRLLRPFINNDGYVAFQFTGNGKSKKLYMHRLVALAFIPNPENLPMVEHIDNDKTNCHVDNLRWATYSENNYHAYRDGLKKPPRGMKSPKAKLTDDEVRWIRKNYIPRDKKFGTRALARKFNVSSRSIQAILSRKTWTHI